jgi:hypothetical protein
MNRRDAGVRLSGTARLRPWLLAVFLFGPAGCSEALTRPQNADEPERDRYEVPTIGSITRVGNAAPTPLGGVGLVVGLDGPGAALPEHRTMLEAELRKMGVKDAREWANRPDAAVVFVTAMMPPGGSKGDHIDVDVALTPHAKATNLRGGYLMECQLYNYDYTQNLSPNSDRPQMMLRGHPVAKAEGPVLVGFGEGDEPLRVKRGRVWGGGRLAINWPLTLVLNPDNQTPTWAIQVAERVNNAFSGGTAVARAHDPVAIPLHLPLQYHLNQQHFLRVVRAIPLYDVADLPDDRPDSRSYRRRLTDDLLDPARTLTAALRLEALGPTAIPALKRGLESPHLLVRFASAQSLAYLNSPSPADELARIVQNEPVMRALALTALASLDESASESRLQELLTTTADDETRYGAFRALRARNERNVLVQGDYLNNSFWLHRVAPKTAPLVHISTNHRAEIVVFGEEPVLRPPFAFHTADFTITAAAEDEYCTVSRYPAGGAVEKRQCKSLRVAEVLRVMAELGGTYPEVVEMLDQASRCQCLSCRLKFDALPLATSVFDLDKAGKGQLDLLDATPDLEGPPTLFNTGRRSQPPLSGPEPGAGE